MPESPMTKTSRAVASPRVVSIADFRPIARRRLPKAVFDYLDGGAEDEITLLENVQAFHQITFRPRNAVAAAHRARAHASVAQGEHGDAQRA